MSNLHDLESKAEQALGNLLSRSQEVYKEEAAPTMNLRRSQRRIEKDDLITTNSLAASQGIGIGIASSAFTAPAPLDYLGQSVGLGRSQFLDFGSMLDFEPSNISLTASQGALRMSSRLRSSKGGGGLTSSQSIKNPEPLTRSQEIRRGLRVSNTLNKTDAFQVFDDGDAILRPAIGPVDPLTYEEMKVLAEQLVRLAPEDLEAVLHFVRGQEPAVLQSLEDAGLQFDLGVLKPETLFSINRYVERKAVEPAPMVVDAGEKDEYLPSSSRAKAGKKLPRHSHKVAQFDPNSMECPECHKRFADKSNLSKHIRTHTGVKPFECEHCHKQFRHSSTLKDHMNTHEAVRPYVCHNESCGKRFSNMANLKRHERTHTDAKPFVCQFCQRPFNQSSNCKQHEKKCGGSTTAIKRAHQFMDSAIPADEPVAKKMKKE